MCCDTQARRDPVIGQQAFRTNRTSRSLSTYAFWAASVEIPSASFQASLDAIPPTKRMKAKFS